MKYKFFTILFSVLIFYTVKTNATSLINTQNRPYNTNISFGYHSDTIEPSRQRFYQNLFSFYNGLWSRNGDTISKYLYGNILLDDSKYEVLSAQIGIEGIEMLHDEGAYGEIMEIFPLDYQRWLDSAGLKTSSGYYAMRHCEAKVAAFWNSKYFEFFYYSNVFGTSQYFEDPEILIE
jgi:hypothetical protein